MERDLDVGFESCGGQKVAGIGTQKQDVKKKRKTLQKEEDSQEKRSETRLRMIAT